MMLRSLASLSVLALGLVAATASRALGGGLKPGQFVVHQQDIPVRIVLIGFEDQRVDEDLLRSWLPQTYTPLVRSPQFYGLDGRNLGLEYHFDYEIVHKSGSFADRFFAYLGRIATPGPVSFFQQLYNEQATNLVDVTGPVLYLDAPRVEKWLQDHDGKGAPGYTVYFVNWYGRSDFRFHVYTRTQEPDPDTGLNFGAVYDEALMSSWGGTSSRNWFYDFSAGPEWNTTNWLVDFHDANGNGIEEYRIPTTWEYATGGYRPLEALGGDMGLLMRFVAINLLFTSSPLYDPMVTAPGPGGAKVAHIAMFEDDPGSSGADWVDPGYARARWREQQPYYNWRVGFGDHDPIDAGAKETLDILSGASNAPGCWMPFGTPFAQLFCYFSAHLDDYVPAYGPRDYVGEVFAFNSTREVLRSLGLLGYADDNWSDGTQTFAYVFGGDFFRAVGYGFTATIIHEMGHHIGYSHAHDGYDSELGFDFGPSEEFYFVWEGDESDTVMHYLNLSVGFGRHNNDNMFRWEAAGYLNWAHVLAGDILASPDAHEVMDMVSDADEAAADALDALQDWRYLNAASEAREAYVLLVRAAEKIGVASSRLSAARTPLPDPPPRMVCRPRLLNELTAIH